MELTVLGSGGWMPREGRATTCMVVRVGAGRESGGDLIVFDAGTGLARLSEGRFARLTERTRRVHVFLSHLHLDHTVGLTFLPALWRADTVIHVPRVVTEGADPAALLGRLVGPPFFPHGLDDFPMDVEVRTLEPGEVAIGVQGEKRVTVSVRDQGHPGGSVGFRMGDAFAFMTDTVHDPGAVDFVAGVDVLIHEAWIRGEADDETLKQGLSAHTSAEGAAGLAARAGVGELLLSHLTPLRGARYHAEVLQAARRVFPNSNLCEDGLTRVLSL